MTESDFQAALNALQMLKAGIEQLVINQAVEIAKLKTMVSERDATIEAALNQKLITE